MQGIWRVYAGYMQGIWRGYGGYMEGLGRVYATYKGKGKVKVKFTLEQITKVQRWSRAIALLFP
jgi:hypothetical protein